MLDIKTQTSSQDTSTALRDLADRIDEGGHASLVCVIGQGPGASIHAFGAPLPTLLAQTADLLIGVGESLAAANTRRN